MVNLLSQILRMPAVHFMAIGVVIFCFSGNAPDVQNEIVIQQNQIEQMKSEIKDLTGVAPNALQVQAAIEQAINDEVLYRQALKLKLDQSNAGVRYRLVQIAQFVGDGAALSEEKLYQKALDLGLDRTDPVVRRQLIANMKLIAAKVPTAKAPSTLTLEQVQAYYDSNKSQFEKPKQISFTQVYLSRDKWKKKGEAEARRLLHDLQTKQVQPPLQTVPGDSFLSGYYFSAMTPGMLQRFFGSRFVAQVFAIEPGQWHGPIASSYGWHLVWVEAVKAPQVPVLDEVLNQVRGAILQEREAIRLNDALQELRSHYTIRVETNANT